MNYTGRPEKVYTKVTVSEIAHLFGVSKYTVKHWIWTGRLNPTSLIDIINKYNNRYLLDRRIKNQPLRSSEDK